MMPGYYQATWRWKSTMKIKIVEKGIKKEYKIKINQNFIVDFCNIFKWKNSISLT